MEGVFLGAFAVFVIGAALVILLRPVKRQRPTNYHGPSPMDMYLIQRSRRNEVIRRMRAVAREHRGYSSTHHNTRK